nr:Crp/Fnr family transcriptional regulator [Pedobacter panaciterrae]
MIEKLKYQIRINTDIDELKLDKIVSYFKYRKVKRSTLLLSEGEVCKELYLVYSGCVRTYYLTQQGYEKTRHIAFDDSIVTSFSSFISLQPSFEFIDTLEDSELYSISRKDFYQLVVDIPEWERFYTRFLEMTYIHQNKKIEARVTLTAKQRYEKLITEHPVYVRRLSNKILASYLDVREETLSRLKSK